MFEVDDLIAGLQLDRVADDRFRVPNMDYYAKGSGGASSAVADIIAGGQLLSQAIVATSAAQPDKNVKSVHAVFARAGRVSVPLEIVLDTVQSGRSLSTVVVSFQQEGRLIATATVVLHAPDADAIRHSRSMPAVPRPGEAGVRIESRPPYEEGIIEATEMADVSGVASPELAVWTRFPGLGDANADDITGQALLAFFSNFPFIGVAMRPHAGLSVEQSHLTVSTGVLAHSISFHEPIDARQWMLADLSVPYSGRGRCYGQGTVFNEAGAVIASISQEGLIRALAPKTAANGASATL
jgi:acyl-CoA thioesterase